MCKETVIQFTFGNGLKVSDATAESMCSEKAIARYIVDVITPDRERQERLRQTIDDLEE